MLYPLSDNVGGWASPFFSSAARTGSALSQRTSNRMSWALEGDVGAGEKYVLRQHRTNSPVVDSVETDAGGLAHVAACSALVLGLPAGDACHRRLGPGRSFENLPGIGFGPICDQFVPPGFHRQRAWEPVSVFALGGLSGDNPRAKHGEREFCWTDICAVLKFQFSLKLHFLADRSIAPRRCRPSCAANSTRFSSAVIAIWRGNR